MLPFEKEGDVNFQPFYKLCEGNSVAQASAHLGNSDPVSRLYGSV